ncbi:MAG: hypothetical protein SynsKO_20350 [Synoicihabitans sp.]
MVAAVLLTRVWWLDNGIWNLDEGATFTMAQQVLEGDVLYRDAADHRSPLMPYLKAVVFAIFGDWNTTAVYAVLAVLLGFCAAAVGAIGSKLDRPLTGWVAALVFIALQFLLVDANDSLSANTEWFVVIFSTAAFWLLVRAIDAPSFLKGMPIGVFFGFSMLCKQPGLLDAIVGSILLGLLMLSKQSPRGQLARMLGGLIIGVAIPMGAAAAYFSYHGAFADYIFYAFTFNTAIYIPEIPLAERLMAMRIPFLLAWQNTPWLGGAGLAAALLGIGVVFRELAKGCRVRENLLPWLFLGWTAAGIATTGLSGREFSHYSQQIIPGLSLAVGWLFTRLWSWKPRLLPQIGPAFAAILMLGSIYSGQLRAKQVVGWLNSLSFGEFVLARQIAAHSPNEERIFIWGYYPELHFESRRLPATRYVYANFITGMIAWTNLDALKDVEYGVVPHAWEKFYEDFHDHSPTVIVDTGVFRGYAKFPLRNREPLWSEVRSHYAQVSCADEDYFNSRLFRRLSAIDEETTRSRTLPPDQGMDLQGVISNLEHSVPQLYFAAPAGIDKLELIANETVVAVLEHPLEEDVSVRFFVDGDQYDASQMWVRATGPNQTLESRVVDYASYAVHLQSAIPTQFPMAIRAYRTFPIAISSNHESLAPYAGQNDTWTIVAPALLRYECPASVDRITFMHGMKPNMHFQSDGYDITVSWIPEDNEVPLEIWQERIQPYREGKHQLPQEVDISLPPRGPGILEIRFTSGMNSSTQFDHLYFGRLTAYAPTPDISLGDRLVMAHPIKDSEFLRGEDGSWILHAPTRVTWDRPPSLARLDFDYGINEGAYRLDQPGQTDGVQFSLQLESETGEIVELFDRTLRPATEPNDRGVQSATVDLPPTPKGKLVMVIGVGDHGSNAWDWAWAGNFVGVAAGPSIEITKDRSIETSTTAGHNGGWTPRASPSRWFAHTPHILTYAKPVDLMSIRFGYGLSEDAVREENGARRSDGVVVKVRFEDDSGESLELFERHLDPFSRPEDAGTQESEVTLPVGQTGKIIFQLEPGPADNDAYDWSYWGTFTGQVVGELLPDQLAP